LTASDTRHVGADRKRPAKIDIDLVELASEANHRYLRGQLIGYVGFAIVLVAAIYLFKKPETSFASSLAVIGVGSGLSLFAFAWDIRIASTERSSIANQIKERLAIANRDVPKELRIHVPLMLYALAREDLRADAQNAHKSLAYNKKITEKLEELGLIVRDDRDKSMRVPAELSIFIVGEWVSK